jgi:hypothetical protein
MRQVAIALVVVTAAAVAGCSGVGSTTVAGAPVPAKPAKAAATASPTTARAASPIEGTWRSGKLTEPEFVRWYKAAGGTKELWDGRKFGSVAAAGKAFFAQLGNGALRYAVITLRFQSGQFAELESGDGGPPVVGDTESYRVAGAHKLIMVDLQGPPCTGTYTFQVTGSRLRLHAVKQCAGFLGTFPTTLFASFPYTKVP